MLTLLGGVKHPRNPELSFTNVKIDYRQGDKFFFFTDGFTDQLDDLLLIGIEV